MKLYGHRAVAFAELHGLTLNQYLDPTSRTGLSVAEAKELCVHDPSLIWVDAPPATQDWTLAKGRGGGGGWESLAFMQEVLRDWGLEHAGWATEGFGQPFAVRGSAHVTFDVKGGALHVTVELEQADLPFAEGVPGDVTGPDLRTRRRPASLVVEAYPYVASGRHSELEDPEPE